MLSVQLVSGLLSLQQHVKYGKRLSSNSILWILFNSYLCVSNIYIWYLTVCALPYFGRARTVPIFGYTIYTQPRYQYYDWNTSFWNCSWTYSCNTFWAFCNSLPSVPSWRSIKSLDLSFSVRAFHAPREGRIASFVFPTQSRNAPYPLGSSKAHYAFFYHTLKTSLE